MRHRVCNHTIYGGTGFSATQNHIIISTACCPDRTESLAASSNMLPGQSHAHKTLTIFQVSFKTKQNSIGYQSGENRPQSTTIGIQKSDGYWTIISEGTPINENIVKIQHEILYD